MLTENSTAEKAKEILSYLENKRTIRGDNESAVVRKLSEATGIAEIDVDRILKELKEKGCVTTSIYTSIFADTGTSSSGYSISKYSRPKSSGARPLQYWSSTGSRRRDLAPRRNALPAPRGGGGLPPPVTDRRRTQAEKDRQMGRESLS